MPGRSAELAHDRPLAGGQVSVVVIEKALQPGLARGLEQLTELTGGHGVTIVGCASGIHPGHNALRICYGGQCAACLLGNDRAAKLGRKRIFQIFALVDTRHA
jgi:hypothetical protein